MSCTHELAGKDVSCIRIFVDSVAGLGTQTLSMTFHGGWALKVVVRGNGLHPFWSRLELPFFKVNLYHSLLRRLSFYAWQFHPNASKPMDVYRFLGLNACQARRSLSKKIEEGKRNSECKISIFMLSDKDSWLAIRGRRQWCEREKYFGLRRTKQVWHGHQPAAQDVRLAQGVVLHYARLPHSAHGDRLLHSSDHRHQMC